MKKIKSVYHRMAKDRKLFFLGFGVLYITEMRRFKNSLRSSELRTTSKQLASVWYHLFKKHGTLSKKRESVTEHKGIFTIGTSTKSFAELLITVGKLPQPDMDRHVRRRVRGLVYGDNTSFGKTKVKILKTLTETPLATNELARQTNFCSGNVFKKHLDCLERLGYLKREQAGSQKKLNKLTREGRKFINQYVAEIEHVPSHSAYHKCFRSKQLAADLLLIISELEMGGIMQNAPYLEMKSFEFVEFIFKVCRKWKWTHNESLRVNRRGKYPPTYVFHLNSKGAREIYSLAGPCVDPGKDQEYRHLFSLAKPGKHGKLGETRDKILNAIKNNINTSSKITLKLQIGSKTTMANLRELVKLGRVERKKEGPRYVYKIK